METSNTVLNPQLLTLNRKMMPISEMKVNFVDADTNSSKNNHGDINKYTSKPSYQFRNNFPSTNEVKFSDSKYPNANYEQKYRNSTSNNNNNINDNCYTVYGDLKDAKQLPKVALNCNADGTRPKMKRFNSNEMDADSIMSASTATTVINKKKPKIPDGGFGWVIVLSSFVISMIIDGIAFSFGLIFTELLYYFNESKTKTAWIGAFFLSVPLLAGPVLSNLVDKYGCRVMTIIGGLVAGIGFVLASVSTSVEMLYVTFGLISGFGIGIGYVTAVVSIAFWFDKKRTFATSLGAAGTGIGTFLYAPFTHWLLETYGWRGTTLILAGTLLNVCVCGCLMRDPDWLIEENRLESRSQSMLSVSNSSVCLIGIRKMLEIGTPGETVLDTLVTSVNTEANQQIRDLDKINIFKRYRSETVLPTYLYSPEFNSEIAISHGSRRSLRRKNPENVSSENIFSIATLPSSPISLAQNVKAKLPNHKYLASSETLNASEKHSVGVSNNSIYKDYLSLGNQTKNGGSTVSLDEMLLKKEQAEHINFDHKIRGSSLGAILENDGHGDRTTNDITLVAPLLIQRDVNGTIQANMNDAQRRNGQHRRHHHHHQHNITGEIVSNLRRNIPLRNSHHFQHMRIHRKAMNYRNAMLNTHRYRLKASSCPNIYRNSMTTLAKEEEDKWYDDFIDIIKSIFDFSMFLDAKFFFFNLSTLFLFIWYIVPYFYITDHLLQYNYKEIDGANLISLIGIFNTIGMVILGYIGDKPWLNVFKTYAVCLVVCGISTALMPLFVYNYTYLLILGMIFGLSFSSSFSFIPIILVQLVDLDDFTCAYGLVLLVQGVGSLIGPPLSGIMYDFTQRWDDAFYAAGFFIAVSGVLAWITGILIERDEDDEDDDDDDDSDT